MVAGISWDYHDYPTHHNTILVLKYDSNGNLLWQQNWLSLYPAQDESIGFHAITTDTAGNIYLGSRHSDQCSTDNFSQCDFDAVLLKLDSNGNFQWASRWGNAGTYDTAASTWLNASDQLLLSGMVDSFGTPIAVLLQYDLNGNLLSQSGWMNGNVQQGAAAAMTLDSIGNVYIASGALNNAGSWMPISANVVSLSNSLISNSYATGIPSGSISQLTNQTVPQTGGVLDTGGGGTDLLILNDPIAGSQRRLDHSKDGHAERLLYGPGTEP